jgi:hypothetical protein
VKKYEFVREIFNACSGSQMRDVDIQEIETDDIDAAAAEFLGGKTVRWERSVRPDGAVVFDIEDSGLVQRLSFTPL